MKYAFVEAHRSECSVKKMCTVLEVSRSGYSCWRKRNPSRREVQNRELTKEIRRIHQESRGVYGSPRITEELRENGKKVGENRVARLMKIERIQGVMPRKFKVQTTDSNHSFPAAPNLLNQDFSASEPNRIWVSDLTYIRTESGFGYLCAVKDLYDDVIVGWSYASHMRTEMVLEALRSAVFKRKPGAGLIFHSDRGSQYASDDFREELKVFGFEQSMSGKGNCYDNAKIESFFARLKIEEVHRRRYRNHREAKENLFDYIEVFYNRRRRHSRLNYLSPIEFSDC